MNIKKISRTEKYNQKDHQKKPLEQDQKSQDTTLNRDNKINKWNNLLKPAKKMWPKLTDDEISKSGGDEQKLEHLVNNRYDISIDSVGKQINDFFKTC